jgi:hypothetical protein
VSDNLTRAEIDIKWFGLITIATRIPTIVCLGLTQLMAAVSAAPSMDVVGSEKVNRHLHLASSVSADKSRLNIRVVITTCNIISIPLLRTLADAPVAKRSLAVAVSPSFISALTVDGHRSTRRLYPMHLHRYPPQVNEERIYRHQSLDYQDAQVSPVPELYKLTTGPLSRPKLRRLAPLCSFSSCRSASLGRPVSLSSFSAQR